MFSTLFADNPFLNYKFVIEIDGIESLGFSEMSELTNETKVFEYKEGGLNSYTHKFYEHTEFSNITLKRGLGKSDTIYQWRESVINGEMDKSKHNLIIKLYSRGNVTKKYSCSGAWISKLEIGALDAKGNDVLIETIELVVERFEKM